VTKWKQQKTLLKVVSCFKINGKSSKLKRDLPMSIFLKDIVTAKIIYKPKKSMEL
jgi:hypothetical protein